MVMFQFIEKMYFLISQQEKILHFFFFQHILYFFVAHIWLTLHISHISVGSFAMRQNKQAGVILCSFSLKNTFIPLNPLPPYSR